MKSSNNNLTTVLNDLVLINNECASGYKKMNEVLEDRCMDLQGLFERMAEKTFQFASDLREELIRLGAKPVSDTMNSGNIYRAWLLVKMNKLGDDRRAMLEASLLREEAIQRAYDEALEAVDSSSSGLIRTLIHSQQDTHRIAFNVLNKRKNAA